jgi:hypothetical protein
MSECKTVLAASVFDMFPAGLVLLLDLLQFILLLPFLLLSSLIPLPCPSLCLHTPHTHFVLLIEFIQSCQPYKYSTMHALTVITFALATIGAAVAQQKECDAQK